MQTVKYIFLSNRPGLNSAGSNKSGLLVAPIMKTPVTAGMSPSLLFLLFLFFFGTVSRKEIKIMIIVRMNLYWKWFVFIKKDDSIHNNGGMKMLSRGKKKEKLSIKERKEKKSNSLCVCVPKPSISVRSWLTTRSITPPPSLPRPLKLKKKISEI